MGGLKVRPTPWLTGYIQFTNLRPHVLVQGECEEQRTV
jgi:hypothetical protein